MTAKIVVGIDGGEGESRAVAYAKKMAKQIDACELIMVYVIEWSPYTFQTPEENAERHKRRDEEIVAATTRVVNPAVEALQAEGFSARGIVRHGDVADLLDKIATEEAADQIIVARTSGTGLMQRVFGSAAAHLVMQASVPVTVVG
jgi:nucleotide-binding universal stress UspA family protein